MRDVPADYSGPDAGYAVIGIGADHGTAYSAYAFQFRPTAPPGATADEKMEDAFLWVQDARFHSSDFDYDTDEDGGSVITRALRPGKYEICNFRITMNGLSSSKFRSKMDFSIPFEIRPGETTYLGNYEAHRLMGKNIFGLPIWDGATFTVSDREDTELRIVRTKNPKLQSDSTDATPRTTGTPLILPAPSSRGSAIRG